MPSPVIDALARLPGASQGGLMAAVAAVLLLAVLGLAVQLWRVARSRRRLQERLFSAHTRLAEMRNRDGLTGLMARPEFEAALEPLLREADRRGEGLAVLVLGLDNFRAVNEAYGLRVGDALLKQVAQRLLRCAGEQAPLARVAGDEFALTFGGDPARATAQAVRLLAELAEPFEVDGQVLRVAASVGIARHPEHGARARLVPHAALAMRSVKLSGGAGHAEYDPAMSVNLRDQAELLQDLRQALARRELQLLFQPKVDAQSLQITAAEALLRWQHPIRGTVSPALFVPMAERHGLIGDIGDWVIEEACRQAAAWRAQGLRMRIAVNLSGHQFRRDDLVGHILATLQRHGMPAERLTCEVTETVAMEDTATARHALEQLRQAGLHVSIDDFGTGYSSLATLRRLGAQELKIDRAFVQDLDGGGEDARSIVRAIVQMAHSLGVRVVAEGVETPAQRDALVALGCDELQGYLFARPMSAVALALWAHSDEGRDTQAFSPVLFEATEPAQLAAAEPGPGA